MNDPVFVQMPMLRTWSCTNRIVWAHREDGWTFLALEWRCHETGEIEYRELPVVNVARNGKPKIGPIDLDPTLNAERN